MTYLGHLTNSGNIHVKVDERLIFTTQIDTPKALESLKTLLQLDISSVSKNFPNDQKLLKILHIPLFEI